MNERCLDSLFLAIVDIKEITKMSFRDLLKKKQKPQEIKITTLYFESYKANITNIRVFII